MANRRHILGALGSTMLAGAAPFADAAQAGATPRWPKQFLWGVATAAHQIEGNNVNSDYWLLEHLAATYFKEPSGDACDSWERWPEDLALVAAMGLTSYRFSIEWARIEPERGNFSPAALAHYRRLCLRCRELGIMPIVTLHHFTSPRWVAAMGGWENPEVGRLFARYCERVARAMGDVMGAAVTMNEPNAQVTSYVLGGLRASPREAEIVAQAKRALGSERFGAYFMGDALKVRDGCLAAHRLAVAAIKAVVPDLKVGMTLALQDLVPGEGGEHLHRTIVAEARAPFYEAASSDNFVGVQPYMRLRTGPDGYLRSPDGVMLNRHGTDVSPDVLVAVLREVHQHCRAPMLITEHGIDTLDDGQRIAHLTESLRLLAAYVVEGAPVLGYLHWSLLDNFEWTSGYVPRFGLVAVDRTTFKRTPKPSAQAYRKLVAGAQPGRGRLRL